mmetsp:Transcript_32248/g.126137  ORF Transcript_32248/g.126137 Transcript_32248/m.126137 type:complete len:226 (+) Transcript_32248:2727-3404(+)
MNSSLLRVFDFFLSPFFSSSRSESLWTFATALKSATAPLVAILLRRRSFSISVAASGITLAFSANFNLSDRLITSSLTFCFSRFLISFRRFKCFPSGSSIPSDPSFSPGARDKIFPSALPKCSTSALSISDSPHPKKPEMAFLSPSRERQANHWLGKRLRLELNDDYPQNILPASPPLFSPNAEEPYSADRKLFRRPPKSPPTSSPCGKQNAKAVSDRITVEQPE